MGNNLIHCQPQPSFTPASVIASPVLPLSTVRALLCSHLPHLRRTFVHCSDTCQPMCPHEKKIDFLCGAVLMTSRAGFWNEIFFFLWEEVRCFGSLLKFNFHCVYSLYMVPRYLRTIVHNTVHWAYFLHSRTPTFSPSSSISPLSLLLPHHIYTHDFYIFM